MDTVRNGPFLGMNTRLPDYALKQEKRGDFVRRLVNIDVDNAGTLRRRRACGLVQAMTGAHSLHLTSDTAGYLVRGGAIYSVTLGPYSETLLKVLTSNAHMSWQEYAGDVYYSNGTDSGRISAGVWYPLGLPTPSTPAVSPLPTGSLYHGDYQLAVSYYNATTGEEGGISASCNYALTVGSGTIRVALPGTTPGATHVNVYCSTVNGSIPFFVASVAAGTATFDVTVPGTGREAAQRYEDILPAGHLFLFNGRLCSYAGNTVYEGLPSRPGYYLPMEGGVPFPADVSNCVPAQNGVYVVADKTYWIPGTQIASSEGVIQDVLPYGGVPHTEFAVEHAAVYGWFGAQGIVLASTDGQVDTAMADAVKIATPLTGCSAVLETEGYRRIVSSGWCMNFATKAVSEHVGFDFTSMSRGYGTLPDGLYSLEGGGAAAVEWQVELGRENFGTEALKHLPAAYVGGVAAAPVQLRVVTPMHDFTYFARSYGASARENRVDIGRGLKANWFDLTLSGSADTTIATVSFTPIASNRRV